MTMSFRNAIPALALLAAACTPILSTEGNFLEEERLALIETGKSTRADVATNLGSPTMVGTFDDSVWYYAGQQTSQVAFHKPEVLDRRVVAIRFDEDGTVANVQKIGLDESQAIEPVDRTTPTGGRDIGIMQQLLGNIGRFSPKDKVAP